MHDTNMIWASFHAVSLMKMLHFANTAIPSLMSMRGIESRQLTEVGEYMMSFRVMETGFPFMIKLSVTVPFPELSQFIPSPNPDTFVLLGTKSRNILHHIAMWEVVPESITQSSFSKVNTGDDCFAI